MSIHIVLPMITLGYGLKSEDLDEIISLEGLKDISQKFSGAIQIILKRFNSDIRMRIIEFNEISGSDEYSRQFFNRLIYAQRHLFYSHIHSNRDTCVVFFYSGLHKGKKKLLNKRLLPHEFAHHYQWTMLGFPVFLYRGIPKEYLPQFAKVSEIGPSQGSIYVDNLPLPEDGVTSFLKDFGERISDLICERILMEKGFREGAFEEYCTERNVDPAFSIQNISKFAALVKYMRRLALRDVAEWHAILDMIYPSDFPKLKEICRYDRKQILLLNKDYDKAKYAFRKIYEISSTVDHNSFKETKSAIDYIKEIAELLNINVKTEETW